MRRRRVCVGGPDGGWRLALADGSGHDAEHVWSTIPLPALAGMVDPPPPARARWSPRPGCGIGHGPAVPGARPTAVDGVRRPLLPRSRGVRVPALGAPQLPRQPRRPGRSDGALRGDPVLGRGRRLAVRGRGPGRPPRPGAGGDRAPRGPSGRGGEPSPPARLPRLPAGVCRRSRRLGALGDRGRAGHLRPPGPVHPGQHAPRPGHGLGRRRCAEPGRRVRRPPPGGQLATASARSWSRTDLAAAARASERSPLMPPAAPRAAPASRPGFPRRRRRPCPGRARPAST